VSGSVAETRRPRKKRHEKSNTTSRISNPAADENCQFHGRAGHVGGIWDTEPDGMDIGRKRTQKTESVGDFIDGRREKAGRRRPGSGKRRYGIAVFPGFSHIDFFRGPSSLRGHGGQAGGGWKSFRTGNGQAQSETLRKKLRIFPRCFTIFHNFTHRSGPWFGFPSPPQDGCPEELFAGAKRGRDCSDFYGWDQFLDANPDTRHRGGLRKSTRIRKACRWVRTSN